MKNGDLSLLVEEIEKEAKQGGKQATAPVSQKKFKKGTTEWWKEQKKTAAQSTKLGKGGRFEKLKSKISAKGGVKNPAAVAAAIGRKKHGKSKMAKWSAKERKKTASFEGSGSLAEFVMNMELEKESKCSSAKKKIMSYKKK